MRTAAVLAALAIATLSTAAHADEPVAPPPVELKSPAVAVGLSVGATLAGYALLANAHGNRDAGELGAALVFAGPSAGEWYAGKVGGIGMGIRSAGLVFALYGVLHLMVGDCFDCSEAANRETTSDHNAGVTALTIGATLWIGGTLYDWYAAYHDTNAYNERHAAIARQLAPTMLPTQSGGMAPGMALSTRF